MGDNCVVLMGSRIAFTFSALLLMLLAGCVLMQTPEPQDRFGLRDV